MSKYRYAVIDIETTGLSRFTDRVTFIGIGLYSEVDGPIQKGYILNMSKPESVKKFKSICDKLREHKLRLIFQGGKFDTLFLEFKYKVRLPIHDDTLLMGTAYDLAGEHGLKAMAQKYLGVPNWDIPTREKTKGSKKVIPYLKKDVRYTWEVFCYLTSHMSSEHMHIYRKLLKPAYLMYRDVERNGAYIDQEMLKAVIKKYKAIEEEKLAVLNRQYKINWNSSQQLQDVLFNKERMPVIKKSPKTGAPSADAGTLHRLAAKGYTLPTQILEYKDANTFNKMFLSRWPADSAYDGRVHPTFGLTNVKTGRTSCSNPNLQQVPRERSIREIYRAPKGRKFFEADYSQLELRIAADYANEPTMLDIYRNNGDIHTETALLLTNGKPPTKEQRGRAKAVNFGFLYGMLANKFIEYAFDSYGVVFTREEAEHFRMLYFQKYSRLLQWHKEMEQTCEMLGGVANKFGRFRRLPDIYSQNKWERLGAVRRAINTPVQGTGSDILIGAATQLHNELKGEDVMIVGTVHDSILGEFNEEDEEWVVPYIRKVMSHPAVMDEFGVELKVPLECDIGVGPWGTH